MATYTLLKTRFNSVPAEIISEVPSEVKEQVSRLFRIGPSADKEFWCKERSTMDIDRGPCNFLFDDPHFESSMCGAMSN